jgi:tetratricopeptide (TPR) repeat protein
MSEQRSPGEQKAPRLTNERATESVVDTLKANERVSAEDPRQGLADMQEFLAARGPHPQLLCRIAVLQQLLGEADALETAREATRLALALGNPPAISELLVPFGDQWDSLGIDTENWLKLGHAHRATGRPEVARSIYRRLLREDPKALPAVKGLLQIADGYTKRSETLPRALEVFDELDRLAPDHPFGEYVEQAREDLDRRMAPVS